MSGALRDISLRHLPDLSDASLSFSFRIPTDAGEDLLRAEAGDFLPVEDSPIRGESLLHIRRATMDSPDSRVQKPIPARPGDGKMEKQDEKDGSKEKLPVVSVPAPAPMEQLRTAASAATAVYKPSAKSNPSKLPSTVEEKDEAGTETGMAARLLMYGYGLQMDVDVPGATDLDVEQAMKEAADAPIFDVHDARSENEQLSIDTNTKPKSFSSSRTYLGRRRDVGRPTRATVRTANAATATAADMAMDGDCPADQLDVERDAQETPVRVLVDANGHGPEHQCGAATREKEKRPSRPDRVEREGRMRKDRHTSATAGALGKRTALTRSRTTTTGSGSGNRNSAAEESETSCNSKTVLTSTVQERGKESERARTEAEAEIHSETTRSAFVMDGIDEVLVGQGAATAVQATSLPQTEEDSEEEDRLTLLQLSSRKDHVPASDDSDAGAQAARKAAAAAPTTRAAPARLTRARNGNILQPAPNRKAKSTVAREKNLSADARPEHVAVPVELAMVVGVNKPTLVCRINSEQAVREMERGCVSDANGEILADAHDNDENVTLGATGAIDTAALPIARGNEDEDRSAPLTLSQLSPRKVQVQVQVDPREDDVALESAGPDVEGAAVVRAPSPMRPAAKHPRPASAASDASVRAGTAATKKSRMGNAVAISASSRGGSRGIRGNSRGNGRGRVASAPHTTLRKSGSQKVSQLFSHSTSAAAASDSQIRSTNRSQARKLDTRSSRSGRQSGARAPGPADGTNDQVSATLPDTAKEGISMKTVNKGYTIPDFKAMHASLALRRSEAVAPLAAPTPFTFSTDSRMRERQAFDAQVRAREEQREREREREREAMEAKEEEEIREMRRRAVPKAHEVPQWYKEAPRRNREA